MSTALKYVGAAMSYMKAKQENDIEVKSEEIQTETDLWAGSEDEKKQLFVTTAIQSRNDRSADVTAAIVAAKASVQAAQQLIIDDEDREDMLDDFLSMELKLSEDKAATEAAIATAKTQLASERETILLRIGTSDEFVAASAEAYSNVVLTA
tara:strand:- start:139 stop:594 length:456 start_codon:yes stop_codon:yes gene_type:complete